jgi:aryl-alcohol dehydrogenase-like predicted oxidoreductase
VSVSVDPSIKTFRIGASPIEQLPLGLGGSWFVPYSSPGAEDANILGATAATYEQGIRHFDTGAGYGDGHSEELYGQFLAGKRDSVFLASKSDPKEATAASMIAEVEGSLRRLGTDRIDLYYIHWPKAAGVDMRPIMEGLETLRRSGKILAVGVSNFSVSQMEEVQQVGTIDAHQLGYNLLWRFAEEDVIPFCQKHDIAVVSYSTLAHGILTGKFNRDPGLREGDQRHRILPFRADVWPHVYEGVEKLKAIAARLDRPLMELALRWTLAQPGIASVLMGARNREQADANARALTGAVPAGVFAEMTAISDEIVHHMPRENNLFGRKG